MLSYLPAVLRMSAYLERHVGDVPARDSKVEVEQSASQLDQEQV